MVTKKPVYNGPNKPPAKRADSTRSETTDQPAYGIISKDGKITFGDPQVLGDILHVPADEAYTMYQENCGHDDDGDEKCPDPDPPITLKPNDDTPTSSSGGGGGSSQPGAALRHCIGLDAKSNKYIDPKDLKKNIETFCADAAKQGKQDPGSGSLQRKYNLGTPEEISLAIDWPSGLPDFKPDEQTCKDTMNDISVNCDGNDPVNPRNWKGGGTNTAGKVKYGIYPLAVRQPLLKKPTGHLESTGLKFWLSGAGWVNNGNGEQGLKDNLNGCSGSGYDFSWGLGNDGREWTMSGMVGSGKCVHDAVIAAGGPDDLYMENNQPNPDPLAGGGPH